MKTLTDHQKDLMQTNELFQNAVLQVQAGVDPLDIIEYLCIHIDNLDKLISK